ncbi:MAG: class I SAM-dependent methyltransferase [Alteromonadaceae bacterium]|nr:class I SAM-dependent methyltransferase [Alteromonadaceae bacterium]
MKDVKTICPVCRHTENTALLALHSYPIYQHPMANTSTIPLPHTIDLEYLICDSCAHAFQRSYDRDILEKIYSCHYYTPAPSGVGATFRNDFIHFIKHQSPINKDNAKIFEVGCSSGEILSELKSLYPNAEFSAVEPNEETAIAAQKNGFEVATEFFTTKYSQTLTNKFDVIYSRHVIEHIFDFEDFFNATTQVCHNKSQLILETPSLDWATENSSTMAFHVEHVHVFSERSLVTLAQNYGWFKEKKCITSSGNLIVSFSRTGSNKNLPTPPHNQTGLQSRNQLLSNKIQNICKDKQVIFWGAGIGAVTLLALSKLYQLD